MNGVSSQAPRASADMRTMFRRVGPLVLAILVAWPAPSPARVYWSVNIGPGYPAYRVYRPHRVYRAYPVYSAYTVYSAYPVYPAYYRYRTHPSYAYRYVHYHYPDYGSSQVSATSSTSASTSTSNVVAASSYAVRSPPPPLPAVEQPPIPGDGYLWTPGYWAYAADGYYWVPGAWVQPPYPGALWTPGYWAWSDGYYVFRSGYWGLHVGYYGGIDYGFGYFGAGYAGGYWNDGEFHYNRAVNNLGVVRVRNAFDFRVVNLLAHRGVRASFNGGPGGVHAQPSAAERAAAREPHQPALAIQQRLAQAASQDRAMLASVNRGMPPHGAATRAVEDSARANLADARGQGGTSAIARHADAVAGEAHSGDRGAGRFGRDPMTEASRFGRTNAAPLPGPGMGRVFAERATEPAMRSPHDGRNGRAERNPPR